MPDPGMPTETRVPCLPKLTLAPRLPTDVLTPDLLMFSRIPGAILILFLNLNFIAKPLH